MATLNDLGYPLLASHDLEEDQAILDLWLAHFKLGDALGSSCGDFLFILSLKWGHSGGEFDPSADLFLRCGNKQSGFASNHLTDDQAVQNG